VLDSHGMDGMDGIDESVREANIEHPYEDFPGGILGTESALGLLTKLPTYKSGLCSQDDPLTLTDCHIAILAIISRARLAGFHIARRSQPVFRRMFSGSRELTLQGVPRRFDVILSSVTDVFSDFLGVYFCLKLEEHRLKSIFERLLVGHKDFQESSSDCLLHQRIDCKANKWQGN